MLKTLFSDRTDFASPWLCRISRIKPTQLSLLPDSARVVFVFTAFDLLSVLGETFRISTSQLESTDDEGQVSLHFAAANNALSSLQWIQKLYDHEVRDLSCLTILQDSHGQTPISLAAQNGHNEVLKLLLNAI